MPGVELLGNVGLLIHGEEQEFRQTRKREEEEEAAAGHGGQNGLSTRFLSPLSVGFSLSLALRL